MKISRYWLIAPAVAAGWAAWSLTAQESSLSRVPVADEAVDLAAHPVRFDPTLGASVARLGEGKLFQSDLTLVEIPPGGTLPPERHLAEEVIYMVSGAGYTTMWTRPGETPRRYDWKAGDLISPSLNAWHQHFNASADTPARYVSMTSTPLTMNLFHDAAFLTTSGFVFEERWEQGVTRQPAYKSPDNMDLQAGHFLPDLPGMKLQARGDSLGFTVRPDGDMAGNHILQTLIREYRDSPLLPLDGHTHPWETAYLVLAGEGATLLKRGDEPARLVIWKKGDLIIVGANEYHDNGSRAGADSGPPYPRLMQMRPAGYFFGVGDVGEEDHSPINLE